jgi:hypothetical protein
MEGVEEVKQIDDTHPGRTPTGSKMRVSSPSTESTTRQLG